MKRGERVGVIGVGQVRAEPGQSFEEMIFGAASRALHHAGLERDQIDNVVIAGSDEWDGRPISSMLAACPAGAYFKDEIKVTDGGIYGLVMGCLRILSGVFETSLVVSWTKPSEAPARQVETLLFEPIFSRPSGLSMHIALAMEASRYMANTATTEEDGAGVLVKNRANGAANPVAPTRPALTISEALHQQYVATPLRQGWIAPDSDGACAMVLTTEPKARKVKPNPAYIEGVGWSIFEYQGGDGQLGKMRAASDAAARAYKMAGIKNPVAELDVAEVCDITPFHELMLYEALGICRPGEGKRLVRDGATLVGSQLPVNPSGGLLCFHPPVAGSLLRAAEAALQVMGEAGAHQVLGAKRGLAQGATGPFSQGACVAIFSGE